MIKFIRLIQNENMKMFSRVGTWVMLGFFLLIILLNISFYDPILTLTEADPFSQFLVNSVSPMVIIAALAIIWSAGIMSTEFSTGTIKLLLIRPVTRSKILWAKYLLVVLYSLALTVIYFVLTLIYSLLAFPGVSLSNPDVSTFGQASLMVFLEALFMITLTYMIAILSHNRSLALGLSMFLYFGNGIFGFFLQNKVWAKYLFFTNLNLTKYFTGGLIPEMDTTLSFSLTVLGAYFIVFLVATWFSFVRRDVTN